MGGMMGIAGWLLSWGFILAGWIAATIGLGCAVVALRCAIISYWLRGEVFDG